MTTPKDHYIVVFIRSNDFGMFFRLLPCQNGSQIRDFYIPNLVVYNSPLINILSIRSYPDHTGVYIAGIIGNVVGNYQYYMVIVISVSLQ